MDPIVTGLHRVTHPKPNRGGSIVLAFFDAEVAGFALNGCALVRTPRLGLTVWPPKLDTPESARRGVIITDNALRHAITMAARDAYRVLGGKDAEWLDTETGEPIAQLRLQQTELSAAQVER